MADRNDVSRVRGMLNAVLDAVEAESPGSGGGGDSILIDARPPRIEIKPRSDIAAAPPSEDTLTKWKAGLRPVAETAQPNTIEILDVIGYDWWTGGGITSKSVRSQLAKFGSEPVEVLINSPGGDMFEGIAIYNELRAHKGKITVKVLGLAASAASIIAMAGDEREIGEGAFLMIHNCWVVALGNRHDMRECADYLEPFDHALRDIYVSRSKQKKDDVEGWMDKETYFSAQQSIDLGFATGMIPEDKITEDSDKTKAAATFNTVRKVESLLTKEGGMTRSQARAVLNELKGGKQDAPAGEHGGKPGAVTDATPGAGNWVEDLKALIRKI